MSRALLSLLVLFALVQHAVLAVSPRAMNLRVAAVHPPQPTQPPLRNGTLGTDELRRRQMTSIGVSTCGYYNGDPEKSRTADSPYGCRVDVNNGLWGFCPTTVISATDCGLAGRCVDSHSCTFGCGKTGVAGLTTFTCTNTAQYCSTVLLKGNFEGAFSYIACGAKGVTETLMQQPTLAAVPSVTITPDPSTSSEPETTKSATESTFLDLSTSSVPTSTGSSSTSSQSLPPAGEPTSSQGSDGEKSSDGPNTTGVIIGGVIGGIAIVCATVVTAVYLLRRNRGSQDENEERKSRFFSWGRSSVKPPTYDQSETDSHSQHNTDANKAYGGWGPAEVYGSEVLRNPTAPVELPGAPSAPAELYGQRY